MLTLIFKTQFEATVPSSQKRGMLVRHQSHAYQEKGRKLATVTSLEVPETQPASSFNIG